MVFDTAREGQKWVCRQGPQVFLIQQTFSKCPAGLESGQQLYCSLLCFSSTSHPLIPSMEFHTQLPWMCSLWKEPVDPVRCLGSLSDWIGCWALSFQEADKHSHRQWYAPQRSLAGCMPLFSITFRSPSQSVHDTYFSRLGGEIGNRPCDHSPIFKFREKAMAGGKKKLKIAPPLPSPLEEKCGIARVTVVGGNVKLWWRMTSHVSRLGFQFELFLHKLWSGERSLALSFLAFTESKWQCWEDQMWWHICNVFSTVLDSWDILVITTTITTLLSISFSARTSQLSLS